MSSSPANQTIMGVKIEEVYATVPLTMPDGTVIQKLVQRALTPAGDYVWEEVDPKIKEFEGRFKDTTTVPADWRDPDTKTLDAKPTDSKTRQDLERMLILTIGDPADIIQRKALQPDKLARIASSPPLISTIHEMIRIHGGKIWADAGRYLPKPLYQTV